MDAKVKEAMGLIAGIVTEYFFSLTKSGIDRESAIELTKNFQDTLLSKSLDKKITIEGLDGVGTFPEA